MADLGQNGGEGNQDQTVKIGEVEYTLDQVAEMAETAKGFKALTEEYPDIDFKTLPGAFTKSRQELADLKKKAESLTGSTNVSDDEAKRRKQIDDFFNDPLVVEKLSARDQDKERQLKEDLAFQETRKGLEKAYDGSDGKPKFVYAEVLKHGKENGIFNLEKAYKDLFYDELLEWSIKDRTTRKRPSTFMEQRGGAGSTPPNPEPITDFKEATRRSREMYAE